MRKTTKATKRITVILLAVAIGLLAVTAGCTEKDDPSWKFEKEDVIALVKESVANTLASILMPDRKSASEINELIKELDKSGTYTMDLGTKHGKISIIDRKNGPDRMFTYAYVVNNAVFDLNQYICEDGEIWTSNEFRATPAFVTKDYAPSFPPKFFLSFYNTLFGNIGGQLNETIGNIGGIPGFGSIRGLFNMALVPDIDVEPFINGLVDAYSDYNPELSYEISEATAGETTIRYMNVTFNVGKYDMQRMIRFANEKAGTTIINPDSVTDSDIEVSFRILTEEKLLDFISINGTYSTDKIYNVASEIDTGALIAVTYENGGGNDAKLRIGGLIVVNPQNEENNVSKIDFSINENEISIDANANFSQATVTINSDEITFAANITSDVSVECEGSISMNKDKLEAEIAKLKIRSGDTEIGMPCKITGEKGAEMSTPTYKMTISSDSDVEKFTNSFSKIKLIVFAALMADEIAPIISIFA